MGRAIKQFHARREEEEDSMNGKYPIALGSGELGCRFQRELQGGNAAEQWEGSSGALDCTKQQQQQKKTILNKLVGFQLFQLTRAGC